METTILESRLQEKNANRRTRKSSGKKASQTIYFVRDGATVHYTGKSKVDAERVGREKKRPVESAGSIRSLPASLILAVWRETGNLASLYTSLGGTFGSAKQNDDKKEIVGTYLIDAMKTRDSLLKMKGKEPIGLPETIEDGEWVAVSVANQNELTGEEADLLLAEFGDEE